MRYHAIQGVTPSQGFASDWHSDCRCWDGVTFAASGRRLIDESLNGFALRFGIVFMMLH